MEKFVTCNLCNTLLFRLIFALEFVFLKKFLNVTFWRFN